jgi:flagellar basal body-associated protein FliL
MIESILGLILALVIMLILALYAKILWFLHKNPKSCIVIYIGKDKTEEQEEVQNDI